MVDETAENVSMLDLFHSELENHSAALEHGLVSVDACQQRIDILVRAAHSLRGAARMVRLEDVARLAQAIEGMLSQARSGARQLSETTMASLRTANGLLRGLAQCAASEIPARVEARRTELEQTWKQLVEESAGVTECPASAEPATPRSSVIVDKSLLELFRAELQNHSRVLEQGLVKAEAHRDPETIKSLMRAAHSLKGATRIIALDSGVKLAHAMEDLLTAVQRGERPLTSAEVDLLLQATDVFAGLAKHEAVDIPEAAAESCPNIEALAAQLSGPAASATAGTGPHSTETRSAETSASPTPSAADGTAKSQAHTKDEFSVRVSVENLNRITGFAGEALVQVRTLHPLSDSVQRMKQRHTRLSKELEEALEALRSGSADAAQARLQEALQESVCIHNAIPVHQADLERFSGKLEQVAGRLYEQAVASRMQPFSDGVHGFARMVRDVAKSLGKTVQFDIEGESTRVDRDILEKLQSPLTHLLRNAVDHGLESPDVRAKAGKPLEGKLILAARHFGGMLEISVVDDGAGIDLERVRRQIVAKGHAVAEVAAKFSESEVLDFLFLPGFSTSRQVTEISGRGVGLDVVQSMARQVGGNVRIESKPAQGTRVTLHLPLTLSVLRTLMFEVRSQPYALPLTRVDRVLSVHPEDVQVVEDRQYCGFEEQNIGLVDATQVLDLPQSARPAGDLRVIVLSDRLNRYGLVVDRLLGQHELVVIPVPSRLGKVPNVSACAILEDGSPVAILDSEDLVRSIDNLLTRGSLTKIGGRATSTKAMRKSVLVVDDSLTVREVERRLLENRGYQVTVAVDGMDGWNDIQRSHFDLVVTDVDMPRMDGIELVKRIKGFAPSAATPVIIVSYKDQEEYRTQGLHAGANYYLTKSSFHDEALVSAVRDLIGETKE